MSGSEGTALYSLSLRLYQIARSLGCGRLEVGKTVRVFAEVRALLTSAKYQVQIETTWIPR